MLRSAQHPRTLYPGRVTYVIDEEGVVRHVFSPQLGVTRPVEHALEALKVNGQ